MCNNKEKGLKGNVEKFRNKQKESEQTHSAIKLMSKNYMLNKNTCKEYMMINKNIPRLTRTKK